MKLKKILIVKIKLGLVSRAIVGNFSEFSTISTG